MSRTTRGKNNIVSVLCEGVAPRRNIEPMRKIPLRKVDLGEQTSFFDHVCWDCMQRECKTSKDIMKTDKNTFESRIAAGAKENMFSKKLDADLYFIMAMMLKIMQKHVSNDIARWRTKHHSNCTKLQLHALMTKIHDLLKNCQRMFSFSSPMWQTSVSHSSTSSSTH